MWGKLLFAAMASSMVSATQALDLSKVRFNGFGSFGMSQHFEDGYGYSTANGGNGLGSDPDFSVDGVVGLQMFTPIADDLDFTFQVVANGRFDYEPDVEWLFLTYHATPALTLRTGRLRAPLFLYSESMDVGYSYPWVRPPEEVYSLPTVNNFEGIDFAYKINVGDWDITPAGYLGSSYAPADRVSSGTAFDLKRVFGASLTVANEYVTFRISHSQGNADFAFLQEKRIPELGGATYEQLYQGLQATFNQQNGLTDEQYAQLESLYFGLTGQTGAQLADNYQRLYDDMNMLDADIEFSSIGMMVDYENWLLNTEFVRRVSGGFPADHEAGYVMFGHRFEELTPTITLAYIRHKNTLHSEDYDLLPSSSEEMVGRLMQLGMSQEQAVATLGGASAVLTPAAGFQLVGDALNYNFWDEQNSVTLGLRWDITIGVAMKAEYKHVMFQNDSPSFSYPDNDYNGQAQPDNLDMFNMVFDVAF